MGPPVDVSATATAKHESTTVPSNPSSLSPTRPRGWTTAAVDALLTFAYAVLVCLALAKSVQWAYEVRLYAIKVHGAWIHEYDPWFNYRATEYLAERGWHAFFTWFDHLSWYPLGRPVATTIYPGMQITAVAIWRGLNILGQTWSLNDVCCYVPAWFGAVASVFSGIIASECLGGSGAAAAVGAAVMSVIPAHAMRSVGGKFDNECVAIPALCATFALWCRSLRTSTSWPTAALAGVLYAYLVSSWGGYVFALNVVGVHVAVLLIMGYFSEHLYRAYTLFFVVGTFGAVHVPCVAWLPLKSLEQIGPLGVFVALQIHALWRHFGKRRPTWGGPSSDYFALLGLGAVVTLVFAALVPTGSFAPFSARVWALFGASAVKTGNPLVDSVSEHNPSDPSAYWRYLNTACYVAPVGILAVIVPTGSRWMPSETGVFLVVWGAITYFFSLRMSRLMVFMGPLASVLTGVAIGRFIDGCVLDPVWHSLRCAPKPVQADVFGSKFLAFYNALPTRVARLAVACALLKMSVPHAMDFHEYCWNMVQHSLSHPDVVWIGDGGGLRDDYPRSYYWLRDNTPADARVMAWWDYGYQIAGMANRTTLADGNTWNQDHIGLIGLAFSSPVSDAHRIVRHLADYILIWTGVRSSDVGKSGHMARIANSVYKGHCSFPSCNSFSVHKGRALPMMAESLIWKLDGRDGTDGRTFVNTDQFQEVYMSPERHVRIIKVLQVSEESKRWAADPKNRLCDAPGSWYCPGQYPPLLRALFVPETAANNSEAAAYQKGYQERLERQRERDVPKPNGPGIPDGTYLGSCGGCSLRHDQGRFPQLSCTHCHASAGASVASTLSLQQCPPPRSVDNLDGELSCSPLPNSPDIPPGGYTGSCLGCSLNGGILKCTHCGRIRNPARYSSYTVDRCKKPGTLDNQDGILTCVGIPNARDIPDGGYQGSCQGCRMEGNLLRCSHCRTVDGHQVEATLSLPCKGKVPVGNSNGKLVCR
eukprot:TRINITY_DN7298_c0_g1_i1.p1 TRINITY_DN7298_c0_g1~~TRINITY_DN7298_c0_g1_i1.p1  ORF type:complete len:987 (+),score=85.23 TRINITY_DN7298_c0_g1_i1:50-3010(+)